jgi:tetratricopeptide (TPR) repeat protein
VLKKPLHLLTYDNLLDLFDDIESGVFEERATEEDVERMIQLLVLLARAGVLPGDEEILERDIEELLDGREFVFEEGDIYSLIPVICDGSGDIVKCKGWWKKQVDRAKKFMKKHKKGLIIGAVVAVVAAVVVVAVVAAAPAAAAGAAAAASAATDGRLSVSKAVLEERTDSLKESLASEGPDPLAPYDSLPWEERGRALGSLLAHHTLGDAQGNGPEIGQRFLTAYAPASALDFQTHSYQLRGESALAHGYYEQAVNDFGRVIELSPHHPLPHLERGAAYFALGDYDRSLEDYHQYAAKTSQPFSLSDFSLGLAKGVPKGIYDSGEGCLLFLSDLVTHPVRTGEQMWEALSTLSDLAKSEQWEPLAEALAPEMHQLITQWDFLPSDERGELAGYALGKYGSDIITPGVLAKALSSGVKGAQELGAIYKNLQNAERTLLLESVAGLENGSKIAEVIQSTQKTIALAEELGFTAHDMAQLKQAGRLEEAVSGAFERVVHDPALRDSYELFKNAEAFLRPYKGFLSEAEARELIHRAGLPTFPRPAGIPDDFKIKISNGGAGIKYVHPENGHVSVRVMPGKPHSPNPSQQRPYVIHMQQGVAVDKFGNHVSAGSPEAHIPIEEFVYRLD